MADYSVVIPARDAARTLGSVLTALAEQQASPTEVIVVDDGSTDETAAIAADHGARVLSTGGGRFAGGARNAGWDAARGDVVVFLDADVVPAPGWGTGIVRAMQEFPGALVGCARTFEAETPWGWVCHLQVETPYLPRGGPREATYLSAFCLLVPRDAPLRWDESYGGEDALFCADALAGGLRLVFDTRFSAAHEHERRTFGDLRRQQRRLAYGMARARSLEPDRLRRTLRRVPLQYFALLRLPVVYRRIADDPRLRSRFLSLLPRLAVAEWTLGASAVRYAARPPALRGGRQPRFE
ncbi:MAG TPA: glycosyltransferase family 2 protein [Gaiellaceae bacterium]|nr:glycosyltransferase family 2 protein [Gaiellaceae bacterium]